MMHNFKLDVELNENTQFLDLKTIQCSNTKFYPMFVMLETLDWEYKLFVNHANNVEEDWCCTVE